MIMDLNNKEYNPDLAHYLDSLDSSFTALQNDVDYFRMRILEISYLYKKDDATRNAEEEEVEKDLVDLCEQFVCVQSTVDTFSEFLLRMCVKYDKKRTKGGRGFY